MKTTRKMNKMKTTPKNKDAYFDLGTTSNTIYITFFARQQVINPE